MRLLATFSILACALTPVCAAQDVYNEINVGTPPNGLFHGGEVDTVQTNNGNLLIEIPLWTLKGRGPLSSGAIFALNTKEWTAKFTTDKQTGLVNALIRPELNGTMGGVVRDINYLRESFTHNAGTQACFSQTGWNSNIVFAEANGTKHHMVPDPADACPTAQTYPAYYADDGSGLKYTPSGGAVQQKDGNSPGGDTNGNLLVNGQDTLGRTIPTGFLTYYDSAGNPQIIQITYTTVAVHTNLCQFYDGWDTCTEKIGTLTEVSQIKLANNMVYTINYVPNDMGEPSSITLPFGGQISWTYSPPNDKGGPIVATRTITANGQSTTWNYSAVTPCTGYCTTKIVDPLLNETYLSYTAFVPYSGVGIYNENPVQMAYVTSKQIKDKSSGSLVLVKTETTDYSNSIGPVLPIRTTTTWNQTNAVSKVETDYDSFAISGTTINYSASNPIAKREYDWGTGAPGSLLRRTVFNYSHLTSSAYLNANILDRVTSKIVYDSTANTCKGVSQPCAQTTYSYDSTSITSTSGTPAPNHDYTGHGSTFTVRGNLTQASHWLNSNGTWLNTTNTYDDLGNLRSTTDPNGNVTSFSYTDNFTDGVNRNAQAFVTQVTHPTTNGVNHIEKKQFFWHTSLVAALCGQNFSSACANTYSPPQLDYVKLTYDNMFRPLTITRGDGGTTTANYNDLTLPLSVSATSSITSSLNKTSTGVFDDLFRVKQTQLTSDQQGTVFADPTYDSLGRKSTVKNPHRSGSSPTDGTTTYFYDGLGRSCLVVPPDGTLPGTGILCPSTQPTGDVLTTYSGNTVTVTDQAGKSRKSVTDGLGHLTQVFEDPANLNYETDYQYDALDNLIRVDQKGGDPNSANWRTRTFAYDSLSRLLCAANPEIQIATCPNPDNGSYTAGTTRYSYDSDGNVLTKKSPKPNQTSSSVTVTATFAYDALNRLKSKSFDNGDPTINYAYDGVAPTGCTPGSFSYGNAISKRTAMCDAAGMELWGYSITSGTGWLTTDQRTTNSVIKTTSYQNNFAGMLATLTYPSGRIITYTPDGAGRSSKAVDVPNSISYIGGTCANGTDNLGVCYTPPGAPSSLTNGGSLVSTFYYNSRLQPCRISVRFSGTAPASCTDAAIGNVLDFAYCFNSNMSDADRAAHNCAASATLNNGNVAQIVNKQTTSRTQNFKYDPLNRIQSAYTESTTGQYCWDESMGYDPWGNLLTIGRISGYTCSNEELLNSTATTKNQISGDTYDAAGNLITIPAIASYTYDAENHLKTAAGVTYTYDGDGKRVQKSNGKLYWYGIGSDPLDETDLTGSTSNASFNEYIFFGGKRIARRDYQNNVNYYFADHLGTARIVANSSGTPVDDSDFYPFGGERVYLNSSPQNYKFTGKERDSESGLDNFGARYYSSSMGRWATPDWAAKPMAVPYAIFGNPQSLNLYSYVGNNPLLHFDPDGHCWPVSACAQAVMAKVNQAQQWVQNKATTTSSPTVAATATFVSGVTRDVVSGVASIGTMGSATGACMGGNGCSAGKTALAVGGDLLKAAAIAAPAVGVVAGGGAATATDVATTTVTHFTSDVGMEAISESGMLRAGTYVTTPGEIPAGAASGEVESLLEIGPGKGANSITFDTPNSNLTVPGNGPTTSGGATQFQLQNPTPIDPTKFKPTPKSQ